MTHPMTPTIEELARGLTEAQKSMLRKSEPDDLTGREGVGVDLFTGAHYATAKALERKGLGHREGPGGFRYAGMYWSTPLGLTLRAYLEKTHGA